MSIEIFMDSRIFYSLALVLVISTGTVFAEDAAAALTTNGTLPADFLRAE